MTYAFSTAELSAIQTAYDAAQNNDTLWDEVYETILAAITDPATGLPKAGVDASVWLWVRGAMWVNGGSTDYSTFIRTYSAVQYETRYGVAPPSTGVGSLDYASDQVAAAVALDILTNESLPSLQTIGTHDAGESIEDFFEDDAGGWSGNLLFMFLGSRTFLDQTVLEEPSDTYDFLVMWKAALEAGFAMENSATTFINVMDTMFNNDIGFSATSSLITAALADVNGLIWENYGITLAQLPFYTFVLDTLAANHELTGTAGDDLLQAADGDDTIIATDGDDILDGGEGVDRADYEDAGPVTVIVNHESIVPFGAMVTGTSSIQRLANIEEVVGSSGNDSFELASLPPSLVLLDGGAGQDTLDASFLGSGVTIDSFHGALQQGSVGISIAGFESYGGTIWNDTFVLTGAEASVGGGGGVDFADFINAAGAITSTVNLSQIENLRGSEYADELDGTEAKNSIDGAGGDDTISTDGGDDSLTGGTGSDRLEGGDGRDRYNAGAGDSIFDEDLNGEVFVGGTKLSRAKEVDGGAAGHTSAEDKVYVDQAGNLYSVSAAGLTVVLATGGSLLIEGWVSDGNLDIFLDSDPAEKNPPQRNSSPLVLDLDGDGIELTGLNAASVFFDVDNDGIREATSWVGADDGILTLDRNSNGVIDDISEMFGYGRTVSVNNTHGDGPGTIGKWTSGFEALGLFDENHNGRIDSGDDAYGELTVWRDLNRDGRSTAEELFTLLEAGVDSISLSATHRVDRVGGDLITDRAIFNRTGGGTGEVADVWFEFDQKVTRSDDVVTDPDVLDLPNARGKGAVVDLHLAASSDVVLRGLLEDFTELTSSDFGSVFAHVEAIVRQWHDVETEGVQGAAFVDLRQLEVFESLEDTPFAQGGSTMPRPYAGAVIGEAYDTYIRDLGVVLLLQADFGQAMFPELSVSGGEFVFLEPGTTSTDVLDRLALSAPAGTIEALQYWNFALRVLDTVYESFADVANGAEYRDAVSDFLALQGIEVPYETLINGEFGGDGADAFVTQTVRAGITSYGPTTPLVVGGAGDDVLVAIAAKQVAYFGAGQGNDTIIGKATEYFGSIAPRVDVRLVSLEADDVSFSRGGSFDIVMTIVATGETLTFKDALANGSMKIFLQLDEQDAVQLFDFSPQAAALIEATAGDDYLTDLTGSNVLAGLAGNDVLVGRDGNDQYLIDAGGGSDVVVEDFTGGRDDAIIFGVGIAVEDLTFERVGYRGADLLIRVEGTSDTVTIKDQFDRFQVTPRVERISVDGDDLDAYLMGAPGTAIANQAGELFGYDTREDVFAVDGAAAIYSGLSRGDTYEIVALAGDITIRDSGTDGIEDSSHDDSIVFDGDLADFSISRVGENTFAFERGDLLINVDNEGGSIEHFTFDDQTLSYSEMVEHILTLERLSGKSDIEGTSSAEAISGTSSDDAIYGMGGADTIQGLDGNDYIEATGSATINGGSGADYILTRWGTADDVTGGLGDDTIIDQWGATTIRFNYGDGSDIVRTHSGGTIAFGAGITLEDLHFSIEGIANDPPPGFERYLSYNYVLRISIGVDGAGGSLLLSGPDLELLGGFETIDLAAGADLNVEDILETLLTGTDANQLIVGTPAAETIDGGGGDDILVGNHGRAMPANAVDVFFYDRGDGNDIVRPGPGRGVVEFGAEIDSGDVIVTRAGVFNEQLVLTDKVTGQSIVVANHYYDGYGAVFTHDEDDPGAAEGFSGSGGFIVEVRFHDNTVWDAMDLLEATKVGTSGNDRLLGSGFSETLDGGAGHDTLEGSAGSDVYVFGIGSGQDVVVERMAPIPLPEADTGEGYEQTMAYGLRDQDRIVFGASIELDDLEITTAGVETGDLFIRIRGTNDTLLIRGQISPQIGWGDYDEEAWAATWGDQYGNMPLFSAGVELFEFADGTVLTRQELLGLDGNDIIYGSDYADDIGAGSGSDHLITGGGADTLHAGVGDDTLDGGNGADTYIYETGDGHDVIIENANRYVVDTLVINAIPDLSTAQFTAVGDDLLIEFDGGSITIKNQLLDEPGHGVELFVDGDSVSWTKEDILDLVDFGPPPGTIYGTSGNDTLVGTDGDNYVDGFEGDDSLHGGAGWDVVAGGEGNDTLDAGDGSGLLIGDAGDDTFVYDLSDDSGHVDIADSAGNDILVLAGVDASGSLSASADYYNLILTVSGEAIFVGGGLLPDSAIETVIDGASNSWSYADLLALVSNSSTIVTADADGGTYFGDSGNQSFVGDVGDDFFEGRGGADAYAGDDGYDSVSYRLSLSGVVVDLAMPANNTGDAAGDTFTGIEEIYGTEFADLIVGNSTTTWLAGFAGADELVAGAVSTWLGGGSGNDKLTGGVGADYLSGEEGSDVLDGGAGDDAFDYSAGQGDDTISDSGATDTGDVLWFGNVLFSELTFTQDGDDILIHFAAGEYGAASTLRLVDELVTSDNRGVDELRDGEGAVMYKSDFVAMFI